MNTYTLQMWSVYFGHYSNIARIHIAIFLLKMGMRIMPSNWRKTVILGALKHISEVTDNG